MKRVICFLLALLIFSINNSLAQIPRVINYQGVLLGSNEQPVSEANYKMTFSVYREDGTQLWTEVHDPVFIAGGTFDVQLGIIQPLDLPFNEAYFLGIKVGNDPELQPRMLLTSAAYAIRADDSNQLSGYSVSPTPQPNKLLPLDNNGKFPAGVLSNGVSSGDYLRKNAPDTSRGTSTSPMLLVSNLGDGNGVNARSTDGIGLEGRSTANDGISGWTGSSGKSGIMGYSTEGKGVTGRSDKDDGVVGWTGATDKSGVFGHSTDGLGVTGQSAKSGVYGYSTSSSNEHAGVYGFSENANGVRGRSTNDIGVNGGSVNNNGIVGWTGTSQSGAYSGVLGWSVNGTGVRGTSDNYIGVQASTKSNNHAAIAAGNEGAGPGIYIQGGSGGIAAVFRGNVRVQSLSTQATIIELGEGLDYAEGFYLSENSNVSPGAVVVIDSENPGKLTISDKAYDPKVAGIVAGGKGLGSGVRLGVDQFDCDVALAGRVYCNVDASYGEIIPGDLLTTSPTPGHAMVVKNQKNAKGAILGKAMEGLAQGQKGQILVLVTLQ